MSKIRQVLKVGPMKLVTRYVARKVNVEEATGRLFKVWRAEAFDYRRKGDISEALVDLAEIEDQINEVDDPDEVPAHLFSDRVPRRGHRGSAGRLTTRRVGCKTRGCRTSTSRGKRPPDVGSQTRC